METKKATTIVKKIVLGKNKPASVLRFLCWFTLIWDTIIGLYMVGSGFYAMLKGSEFSSNIILKDFSSNFCFLFAILHGVSLLSAILLYRQKKIGFYLYSISNIAMVLVIFVSLNQMKADYILITFTLAMIGLFATQLKQLS